MNILFTNYFGPSKGGAEISMELLTREIKNKGYNIFIASTKEYGGFFNLKFLKVRYLPFWLRDKYLTYFFRRIIRNKKIDVIHANDRYTSIAAILAGKKEGIKTIVHFRDYWFLCPKCTLFREDNVNCECCDNEGLKKCSKSYFRYFLNLYKLENIKKSWEILKQADVKIVNGGYVGLALEKIGIKEYIILPNVIDFEKNVVFDVRKKYKLNKKVIGFFGNIDVSKGSEVLKKLFFEFKDEKDINFLIVGNGNQKKNLIGYVNENLINNVIFVDWVSNKKIGSFYEAVDIVLFPSLWKEPFGRVLIESIYFGKPFIASNVSDVSNIIKGDYVIIKKDQSINEWKKAIVNLLKKKKVNVKLIDYKEKIIQSFLKLYS